MASTIIDKDKIENSPFEQKPYLGKKPQYNYNSTNKIKNDNNEQNINPAKYPKANIINYKQPNEHYLKYLNQPNNAIQNLNLDPDKLVVPVQNIIHISAPGIHGDHETMNIIYEDMLPKKTDNSPFTLETINERLKLYDFIRRTIVTDKDGEEITLSNSKKKSLLSYLKLVELNPLHYSSFSNNKYSSLPNNFLIYNSCYPITMSNGINIQCAKNSLGINLRIYGLSDIEFALYNNNHKHFSNYDPWREEIYYEYVREEIIKKQVCPNFTLLYAFFMSSNNNINFKKLKNQNQYTYKQEILKLIFQEIDSTKLKDNDKKQIYAHYINDFELTDKMIKADIIEPLFGGGPAKFKKFNKDIEQYILTETRIYILKKYFKESEFKIKLKEREFEYKNSSVPDVLIDELYPMLRAYSGRCLVLLTEAPTQNFYQWGSIKYDKIGGISKMIDNGYHEDHVWKSIVFQLLCALYVMYIKKIAFEDFDLMSNVYIKNFNSNGNMIGYWKYIIDDIPYYVPNYGYLVMIDSNYKDIEGQVKVMDIIQSKIDKLATDRKHKIYGEILKDDVLRIEKKNIENIKKVFDSTILKKTDKFNNPSDDIIKLFDEIKNINNESDILNIFKEQMKEYFHNKIGSIITEDDKRKLEPEVSYDTLKKGDLFIKPAESKIYMKISDTTWLDEDGLQTITYTFNVAKLNNTEQAYKIGEKTKNNDMLETYYVK